MSFPEPLLVGYQLPLSPIDFRLKVEAIAKRIAEIKAFKETANEDHAALTPSMLDEIFN